MCHVFCPLAPERQMVKDDYLMDSMDVPQIQRPNS